MVTLTTKSFERMRLRWKKIILGRMTLATTLLIHSMEGSTLLKHTGHHELRPRGRPPKEPEWYPEAARLIASGLTLRKALRKLGVSGLREAEIKNTYRRVRFRRLVREAREERFAQSDEGFSLMIPVG